MDQSTVKEEILSAISLEIDVWLCQQASIKDGYDYGSRYIEYAQKINRTILMKSLG